MAPHVRLVIKQVLWCRSPGLVRLMANSETLILSLALLCHGEAGAVGLSSAEILF